MDSMEQQRAIPVPGPRSPLPAGLVATLRGERIVVADAAGTHYGYRAWSEVYQRPGGEYVVDIVPEEAWWRHQLLQELPPFQRWQAERVWVE